jgi:hypothetical protein
MANEWIQFVKAYASKNKISYKDAISKARPSYAKSKGKKMKKQGSSDRTNEKQGMEIKGLKDKAKARGRPRKSSKMATAELGGEKIKFKKGGLRKALKVGDEYKFKKGELRKLLKIQKGDMYEFHGKKGKMTDRLKKQVNLALNLMK